MRILHGGVSINKTKKQLFPLFLALIIVLLVASPLASAVQTGVFNKASDIQQSSSQIDQPVKQVDLSTFLTQRGHSIVEYNNLSEPQRTKFILSFSGEDMNKSITQIKQDLFGNSTGSFPIPRNTTLQAQNGASINQPAMTNPNVFTSTITTSAPTSGKGCLIVAIGDYPGTGMDSNLNWRTYLDVVSAVNNAGYDYVYSLVNGSATHTNIWEWVTYFCFTYQNVDVYFIGHGTQSDLGTNQGFCSYDSTSNGIIVDNLFNVYYPNEMQSYWIHPYDYSELRLGLSVACYAGYFGSSFTAQPLLGYPNLPDFKNRVWIGGVHSVLQNYVLYFTMYWTYSWYTLHSDSRTAYNYALLNAAPYQGADDPMSYYYNFNAGDNPITF